MRDFHSKLTTFFHVGNCSNVILIVDIENMDLCNMNALAGYHAVILTFGAFIRVDDNIVDRLIGIYFYLVVLNQSSCFNFEYVDLFG